MTMMSLLRNPRYRGLVLLAGLVAGLVVVVLVVRLAGGGSTDSGGSGEPAAPPTGPAVVSPEPTAPSPMDSAAVRPSQEVFDAAVKAGSDYLKTRNTWRFPLNLTEWQDSVSRYVLSTSPFYDQLVPNMSLGMLKVCEQERCEQSATVEPVGEVRWLGNGGFRVRYLVTIKSNYLEGGERSTVWEVELFGTPPSVNFAIDTGSASGVSD